MDIFIKGFMMILLFISTAMTIAEHDEERESYMVIVTVGFTAALTVMEIAG